MSAKWKTIVSWSVGTVGGAYLVFGAIGLWQVIWVLDELYLMPHAIAPLFVGSLLISAAVAFKNRSWWACAGVSVLLLGYGGNLFFGVVRMRGEWRAALLTGGQVEMALHPSNHRDPGESWVEVEGKFRPRTAEMSEFMPGVRVDWQDSFRMAFCIRIAHHYETGEYFELRYHENGESRSLSLRNFRRTYGIVVVRMDRDEVVNKAEKLIEMGPET